MIGDVAGHGLEAASVMGQLRMAVRAYALEGHSPQEIIVLADALLQSAAPDELVTMLYAEIDADARHDARRDGRTSTAARDRRRRRSIPRAHSAPAARCRGAATATCVETTIEPGTTVILYTDGLVERREQSLDEGLDRLRVAVLAHGDRSLEELCADLVSALVPGEAADDVAILGFQMQPVRDMFALVVPAEPAELVRTRRALAGGCAPTVSSGPMWTTSSSHVRRHARTRSGTPMARTAARWTSRRSDTAAPSRSSFGTPAGGAAGPAGEAGSG